MLGKALSVSHPSEYRYSAITVVSFARKSGVQQIVSVEDFWGGLFLGFLIGFLGQEFALNLITPNTSGQVSPAPSP